MFSVGSWSRGAVLFPRVPLDNQRGHSTVCVGFKHLAHMSFPQLHHHFIAREWFEFLFHCAKLVIVHNA